MFLLMFQLLGLLEIVRLTLFFPSLLFLDLKGTIAWNEYLAEEHKNYISFHCICVYVFPSFRKVYFYDIL
jgi:hypothetical protein